MVFFSALTRTVKKISKALEPTREERITKLISLAAQFAKDVIGNMEEGRTVIIHWGSIIIEIHKNDSFYGEWRIEYKGEYDINRYCTTYSDYDDDSIYSVVRKTISLAVEDQIQKALNEKLKMSKEEAVKHFEQIFAQELCRRFDNMRRNGIEDC